MSNGAAKRLVFQQIFNGFNLKNFKEKSSILQFKVFFKQSRITEKNVQLREQFRDKYPIRQEYVQRNIYKHAEIQKKISKYERLREKYPSLKDLREYPIMKKEKKEKNIQI